MKKIDLKKISDTIRIKASQPAVNKKPAASRKKPSRRDLIYSAWTAAIFLCIALSVFAIIFASCSKGGAEASTSAAAFTSIGRTLYY